MARTRGNSKASLNRGFIGFVLLVAVSERRRTFPAQRHPWTKKTDPERGTDRSARMARESSEALESGEVRLAVWGHRLSRAQHS
jgi:hypothetical protein